MLTTGQLIQINSVVVELAAIAHSPRHVGQGVQSGLVVLKPSLSGFDPIVWSGRALQENFIDLGALRSCINVSGL
jgi:hypothetical protein